MTILGLDSGRKETPRAAILKRGEEQSGKKEDERRIDAEATGSEDFQIRKCQGG
jgi:hypothetical protein